MVLGEGQKKDFEKFLNFLRDIIENLEEQ